MVTFRVLETQPPAIAPWADAYLSRFEPSERGRIPTAAEDEAQQLVV
jgi:hypothetical protein